MTKSILVHKIDTRWAVSQSIADKYSSHDCYTLLGFYATSKEALDKAFAINSRTQARGVDCHIQIDCTGK